MAEASTSVAAVPASSSMKILTIGPAKGQIKTLISKTAAIEAKHGPFHALFVAGDFFSSSETLSQEEQDLFEGKSTLPIRTYIYQATKVPPSYVRQRISSLHDKGKSRRLEDDQVPLQIAENLFWLGKNQVNWVAKDGKYAEQGPDSNEEIIVDDSQGADGLRVAVCGGIWDQERWAKEIQSSLEGPEGAAQAEISLHQSSEDDSSFLLPSNLEKLYRHPAFQAPRPSTSTSPQATSSAEPTTLAAARAQMLAQQQELMATSAGSQASSSSSIDILLMPSWPSGIALFSQNLASSSLPPEAPTWGLPPVAEVMRRARPRYGFAANTQSSASRSETTEQIEKAGWQENGVFWEREPYVVPLEPAGAAQGSGANRIPAAKDVTSSKKIVRFISLANLANPKKTRWFVALNLPIGAAAADQQTAAVKGATQSPFATFFFTPKSSQGTPNGINKKRSAGEGATNGDELSSDVNYRWQKGGAKRQKAADGQQARDDGPPPEGYICRICGSTEHYIRLCPHKGQSASSKGSSVQSGLPNRPAGAEEALGPLHRREPVQMVGPKDCWFCLSNEGCAKHLVVAIGEESYLALPKGQLPPSSSEASPVPGGGHVLIIPVSHVPSVQSMDDPAARARLSEEMEAYLSALTKCYEAHGCIAVAWSIVKLSNTRAGHMQVQVVPVPEARVKMAQGQTFSKFLQSEAAARGYDLQPVSNPDKQKIGTAAKDAEYFQMDILSSSARTTFKLDLRPRPRPVQGGGSSPPPPFRFDLQFPRTTLAKYLGVPDRADWKRCSEGRSDKVEEAETRVFRGAFGEWMPSFGGDSDDDDDEDEE